MNASDDEDLLAGLPALQRLALAYAPAASRGPLLGLLALDCRLAGIVRSASEPMLAQLRLAWWRDCLSGDRAKWPDGDRLLSKLRACDSEAGALVGLVDGWEAMTAPPPLPATSLELLAEARAEAFAGIARALGHGSAVDAARRLARNWALADLASRLSDPGERESAAGLAAMQDWRWQRLPRALRPLAVLHGLAARAVRRGEGLDDLRPGAIMPAIRLGLLGR